MFTTQIHNNSGHSSYWYVYVLCKVKQISYAFVTCSHLCNVRVVYGACFCAYVLGFEMFSLEALVR